MRLNLAVPGVPAAFLALGLVACGSSSPTPTPHTRATASAAPTPSPTPVLTPPASPSPSGSGGGSAYGVQVALSGTDAVQGSFSQTLSQCQVPATLSGTVSGQQVTLLMPGTGATGQPQQLSPGDIQLTVGTHVWGVASASNAPRATSGTLQRSSNGSGSAQFQNLALQSNPGQQPQESGSVTWTCG